MSTVSRKRQFNEISSESLNELVQKKEDFDKLYFPKDYFDRNYLKFEIVNLNEFSLDRLTIVHGGTVHLVNDFSVYNTIDKLTQSHEKLYCLSEFLELLLSFSSLRCLLLGNLYIDENIASLLNKLFYKKIQTQSHQKIIEFKTEIAFITPVASDIFCKIFYQNRFLKKLDISLSCPSAVFLNNFATAISKNRYMTELHVRFNPKIFEFMNSNFFKIFNGATIGLIKTLTSNKSLKILKLSDIFISKSIISHLFNCLFENNSIIQLDLSSEKFTDLPVDLLGNYLSSNPALTSLYLKNFHFLRMDTSSLFKGLENNSLLRTLKLNKSLGLTSDFFNNLNQALTINTTLTELDLSDNTLQSSVLNSLVNKTVDSNSTLLSLNLNKNRIVGSEFFFTNVLSKFVQLSTLKLSDAMIIPQDFLNLEISLSCNTSLTHLDISNNGDILSTSYPIFELLLTNSTLTNLNLSKTLDIDTTAIEHFSTVLSENTSLVHLNLSKYNAHDNYNQWFTHSFITKNCSLYTLLLNELKDTLFVDFPVHYGID